MTSYQVSLERYYGPLDLLLYLVKRNEVDVRDIPVAKLAEQFIEHLAVIELLDVDLAGDFLVMAATLMEIKSKLLLPHDAETPENEPDPRQELVRQLIEYRKFKDAAQLLEARADERQLRVTRDRPEEGAPADAIAPLRRAELWDLVSAFSRLMRDTAALEPNQIVVDETPQHIYEALISERLRLEGRLSFRSLFTPPYYRTRLVGLFLALLELIKHGQIILEQNEPFGEIWIAASPLGDMGTSEARAPDAA
jgi:segregation and condensation protein A